MWPCSNLTGSGLGREPKDIAAPPGVGDSWEELAMLRERLSARRLALPMPSCRLLELASVSKMAAFAPASDQPMNARASAAVSLHASRMLLCVALRAPVLGAPNSVEGHDNMLANAQLCHPKLLLLTAGTGVANNNVNALTEQWQYC